MDKQILVVNPGSTSTKISISISRKQIFLINIKHSHEELAKYSRIADQFDFRKQTIIDELEKAGIDILKMDIIVGRGGILKPISGGVYKVNEAMIRDTHNPMGEHESNLGGLIANELARFIGRGVFAIIVDPVCVDELEEIARISGLPELPRRSFLHTLNQRAVARTYARVINRSYEDINVIVAHMGGGVSVGAHYKGRIIDVNNGLNGDGPMSPERSGGVPVGQLVELCFSGKFTKEEIMKKLKGKGGFVAYLGTSNAIEIEKRIEEGDQYANLIYHAMAYQVAKEIASLSAVLKGEIDGIILTGGLAYSKIIIDDITDRIKHLGNVHTFPGENEMESLAMNGYMVLNGELEPKEYI